MTAQVLPAETSRENFSRLRGVCVPLLSPFRVLGPLGAGR